MGKIHKELKRAEKEFTARKGQPLTERRTPSRSKKKAYLILTIFIALVFDLFYFRTNSNEYAVSTNVIARKFPLDNVAAKSPAKIPSQSTTRADEPGIQLPDSHKDVEQELNVSSRPEPDPIISEPGPIKPDQSEDQKSDVGIAGPLEGTPLTDAPRENANRAIDAAKLDQNEPLDQAKNTPEPLAPRISPHPTAESEISEEPAKTPVFSAQPAVDEKEDPPDPAKLIDWLLKKRAPRTE